MSDPVRILKEALELEPSLRAHLAHELIVSLEKADTDADPLWREEIRQRIDEIEAGTVELEDWKTVRQRLHAAAQR